MTESAPRLTASVHSSHGRVEVAFAGSMDQDAAGIARDVLRSLQGRGAALTLDLSRVHAIDAAGLGVLVASLRRADVLAGSLSVGRASNAVREALYIVGLEQVLDEEGVPQEGPSRWGRRAAVMERGLGDQ